MARLEYRYDETHPAYVELQRHADELGCSLQQLVHLLLVSRYNLRHGLTTADAALWVPEGPVAPPEPELSVAAGATAIADEWL